MNRQFTITLLLVLSGCGSGLELTPTVEEGLQPYLLAFEEEMQIDTGYISASFEPQESPILAVCLSWWDGKREIHVDKDKWDHMKPEGRVQLMYHELGHCAMNLDHDDRNVDTKHGNVYGSIMNKHWFGNAWFWTVYQTNYKSALKTKTLMQP